MSKPEVRPAAQDAHGTSDPVRTPQRAPEDAQRRSTEVAPAPPPVRWHSEALLAGQAEAHIEHGTQVYRLRRTLSGKLILTK